MSNESSDSGSTPGPDPTRLIPKAYRQMLACLFLGSTAVIVVLLLGIFVPYLVNVHIFNTETPIPIFLVVVLAGTMGAFFSSLQRLYDFKELPPVLYEKDFVDAYGALFIYSLVPVLIGGIAAAVLYLVFAGNLLSGSFFPAFGCTSSKTGCADFGALVSNYAPEKASDYAKAILWGFVAGFAERLVPGLLNGFVQNATDAAAKSGGDVAARTAQGGSSEADAVGPRMASRGLANQGRVEDKAFQGGAK